LLIGTRTKPSVAGSNSAVPAIQNSQIVLGSQHYLVRGHIGICGSKTRLQLGQNPLVHMFNYVIRFLKEVRQEMDKVVWPAKDRVIRLTLAVVVIAVVISLYITSLDYLFSKLIGSMVRGA